jgi:hypothetical protein
MAQDEKDATPETTTPTAPLPGPPLEPIPELPREPEWVDRTKPEGEGTRYR